MIPKIIHYCWFGGNPLPKSALKCIDSWRKYLPDYEIKRWDESNFDVNLMTYTQEAYKARKFAYVSDVARFWILYNEGGLYFDTDVEVIKSLDDIVDRGPFMGIEVPARNGTVPMVAPGLGLGAEKGMTLYKEILEHYEECHYCDENGAQIGGTVVSHNTEILIRNGLKPTNDLQNVAGVWIYPQEYFNPLEDATGILKTTINTRSIHWYSKTWCDKPMWYFKITRIMHRLQDVFGLAWWKK